MKRYNYYFIASLLLLLVRGDLFAQLQVGKLNFLNNNSESFICLDNETSLELASVTDDELIINRLESGENGYLDLMLDNITTAEFTIALEEEGGSQVFELVFTNATVTVLGTTENVLDGDFFRIQRCVDQVLFYQNSNLLASASIANNNFPLQARLFISTANLNAIGNRPFASIEFPIVTSSCPPPPVLVKNTYYSLQKMLDGAYALVNGNILRFKYIESYSTEIDNTLSYKIYNMNRVVENVTGTLTKTRGVNYFDLQLSLINKEFYILEVQDSKGLKSYLRFQYNCPSFNGQSLCHN